MSDMYEVVVGVINEIHAERGDQPPALAPATPIMEAGLDSLDIATLVVRLEDRCGVDPFADPTLTEYPRTLSELASLYESARGTSA